MNFTSREIIKKVADNFFSIHPWFADRENVPLKTLQSIGGYADIYTLKTATRSGKISNTPGSVLKTCFLLLFVTAM